MEGEEDIYKYKRRISPTGALWSVFSKTSKINQYTYDCRFAKETIRIQLQEKYNQGSKSKPPTLEYPAYVLADSTRKAENLARKIERATKRGDEKGYSEFN